MPIFRAALAFAVAGFFSGRLPLAEPPDLGAVRAEIAAAHPYARLRDQIHETLLLFRNGTRPVRTF